MFPMPWLIVEAHFCFLYFYLSIPKPTPEKFSKPHISHNIYVWLWVLSSRLLICNHIIFCKYLYLIHSSRALKGDKVVTEADLQLSDCGFEFHTARCVGLWTETHRLNVVPTEVESFAITLTLNLTVTLTLTNP